MSIVPETCPSAIELKIPSCQDALEANLGDVQLSALGRIVQVNAVLKNVCPGKRVAVAVQLTEVDAAGAEHSRGLKVFTVPAHAETNCTDVVLKCIHFVLPEDLDPEGDVTSLCNERNFKAKIMSNYIDSDFACCGEAIL